jgi:phosphonate transport system substrate-binding protein
MSLRNRLLCILGWLTLLHVPTASANGELRLGIVNERPDRPDFALEQYGKLHAYVAERLAARGISTGRLVITQDLGTMANALRSGEVNALIESVMPTFILERSGAPMQPALLGWRKGQREYRTIFFARNDSPVHGLTDLRGRTVAFEAPRSTSAYFVPRAMLRDEGLAVAAATAGGRPSDSVGYVFAGSELNQAYWVHRGKADAGAFNDGDWERTPEHIRRDLRVLATSRPVPRWLMSLRTDLPSRLREAALDVLVHMADDEAGREALAQAEQIARFEPLGAADVEALDYWRRVLSGLDDAP